MNYAVGLSLLLLVGLLTLVSYVDRLYAEIGKFLSREFQDNIDSFEKRVEPRLKVSESEVYSQLTAGLNAHTEAFDHPNFRYGGFHGLSKRNDSVR